MAMQLPGQEVVEVQLLNLLMEVNQDIDTQFQVWISITFAVLVASFVAGHRLSFAARLGIAAAYVAASIILYQRYMRGALDYIPYVFELFGTYGAPLPQNNFDLTVPFQLRRGLLWLGTIFTTVGVLFPRLGLRKGALQHGEVVAAPADPSPPSSPLPPDHRLPSGSDR